MVEAKTSVSLKTIEKLRPAVVSARTSAQQMQSSNNLKQFALAMHMYQDAKKHFPPAVLYGPDGKTPYSWRVELLPYFDEKALYDQYHFDEPWDSEQTTAKCWIKCPRSIALRRTRTTRKTPRISC